MEKTTMTILALARRGHEFVYNPNSAHQVSKAGAKKIRDLLNETNWKTTNDSHWWIFEIDKYDGGWDTANMQKFTLRNGCLRERRSSWLNVFGVTF